MVSTSQKKTLHSILATKLNLTIPPPSTSSSSPTQDFDFSDVFGSSSSPSSSSSPFVGDPEIIHHRSHSYVGPSPRFALSTSLPRDAFAEEIETLSSSDADEDDRHGRGDEPFEKVRGKDGVFKIGPGDFEILRVVGQGAFGKVFQVKKKGESWINSNSSNGDGIYAMKVMRKDTIIKKNHVDYMKAERDILTKVVHPFIVQLQFSFQVLRFDSDRITFFLAGVASS